MKQYLRHKDYFSLDSISAKAGLGSFIHNSDRLKKELYCTNEESYDVTHISIGTKRLQLPQTE